MFRPFRNNIEIIIGEKKSIVFLAHLSCYLILKKQILITAISIDIFTMQNLIFFREQRQPQQFIFTIYIVRTTKHFEKAV